jgi:hypothetical protein
MRCPSPEMVDRLIEIDAEFFGRRFHRRCPKPPAQGCSQITAMSIQKLVGSA